MTEATRPSEQARIDAASLREQLTSDRPPRLLDVRSPAEFSSVHIPGSYNVPLATLREHREELLRHLDSDVVLICRSGQRAEQAECALAEAGLHGMHVLAGGLTGWEAIDGPVNRGRDRWDLERQVRFAAGSLVLVGLLGSLVVPGLQWFSAAIGGGLVFSAVTNTCAMGNLLARMPWNRGRDYDPREVFAQLAGGR